MSATEPKPYRTTDGAAWDAQVLEAQARAHYMQSDAWARTRDGSPWSALRDVVTVTGEADGERALPIQLFERTAPLAGRILFLPRVAGITPEAIDAITARAKAYPKRWFGLKMETFQPETPELVEAFERNGWVPAASSQYQHAVAVDLSGSLEEVAARFKKRARNSYRAAENKFGVTVTKTPMTPENEAEMHRLIGETKVRSGGYFRHPDYFQRIWDVYKGVGQGHFYVAEYEGEVQSMAFVMRFGDTAWYKDAGSIRENAKIFAPYLMQWKIMQDLHGQGVTLYELANIPDPASWETSDIKGLYTFKTAWAPEPVRYMPTYELPLTGRYALWAKAGRWLRAVYTRRTGDAWF